MGNGAPFTDFGPQASVVLADGTTDLVFCNQVSERRLDVAPDIWPAHAFPTIARYPGRLKTLAKRCLNFDRAFRPTLAELQTTIAACFADFPNLFDDQNPHPVECQLDGDFQLGEQAQFV